MEYRGCFPSSLFCNCSNLVWFFQTLVLLNVAEGAFNVKTEFVAIDFNVGAAAYDKIRPHLEKKDIGILGSMTLQSSSSWITVFCNNSFQISRILRLSMAQIFVILQH